MRSPSFSLFSSSVTTRNSPAANDASASSIASKENEQRDSVGTFKQPFERATGAIQVRFPLETFCNMLVINVRVPLETS